MNNGKRVLIALIVLAVASFWLLGGDQWLTLEALKQNRQALTFWIGEHRTLALLAYTLTYVLVTSLSLPGAAVHLTPLGGLKEPSGAGVV